MLNDSLFMSDRPDWETPADLFSALNAEFAFTLDPCADASNAKCAEFYTLEQDGLSLPWVGTVYVNPPYGRGIDRWVAKARLASANGATVVCLVPARTDTRWWHAHVMSASEVRFLTRRLTFVGAGNKATFPAAIVVYRPNYVGPAVMSAQVV